MDGLFDDCVNWTAGSGCVPLGAGIEHRFSNLADLVIVLRLETAGSWVRGAPRCSCAGGVAVSMLFHVAKEVLGATRVHTNTAFGPPSYRSPTDSPFEIVCAPRPRQDMTRPLAARFGRLSQPRFWPSRLRAATLPRWTPHLRFGTIFPRPPTDGKPSLPATQ
jgi:hypothetical protein